MTDHELDQILDLWQRPMPSAGLRERVLGNALPAPERKSYRRPLQWTLLIAAATCVLSLGMGQTGGFSLDNAADRLNVAKVRTVNFFGSLWWNHVLNGFLNSHPTIYLDGKARSDLALSAPKWIGGQGFAMWVNVPGERRYAIAIGLDLTVHRGPPPLEAGQFDGHVLEFHAADRLVRIESGETFGFGATRKVHLLNVIEDN